MKAKVVVADTAQVVEGKIYASGLGWSETGSPMPPHAVIILLDVGWNETNRRLQIRAELVDSDGRPVTIQTKLGEETIAFDAQLAVGQVPRGSSRRTSFAASVEPLTLQPGTRYEWRVTVDGQHEDDWSESFTVRRQEVAGVGPTGNAD